MRKTIAAALICMAIPTPADATVWTLNISAQLVGSSYNYGTICSGDPVICTPYSYNSPANFFFSDTIEFDPDASPPIFSIMTFAIPGYKYSGLSGVINYNDGLLSGSNLNYFLSTSNTGGSNCGGPFTAGACVDTTASASTFNVSFLSSVGGPGPVPEPATWAMLLVGFGMIGFAMRKRSNVRTAVSYALRAPLHSPLLQPR